MATATLTPQTERTNVATPTLGFGRVVAPKAVPVEAMPQRLDWRKIVGMTFILCAGLMLCSFNLSGIVHESEWVFFFCLLPQTLALGAIFIGWFTALFFAEM